MTRILYIHGFKSTGNALKAQILKKKFDNVFSPTMPISPKEAMLFLEKEMIENQYDLVIGSSLGGFLAMCLHKEFGVKVLLINPSLAPWESLKNQVGIHKRFEINETFEWTEEYNEQLQTIDNHLKNNTILSEKLYFFLSSDDELLNHSKIPDLFPKATIKYFDNAGHQFTAFTRTIPEIKEIIECP